MNKIWILLLAAVLSFNAHAADKKSKKAKGNPAYTKLIAELKLSDEQKPKFQALQKEQKAFMAEQKKRSAEEKKTAGQPFYKARTAKLKELFTEDQLKVWREFQSQQKAAREKKAQEKK